MPRMLMVLSLLATLGIGAQAWACDDKNKEEKKDKSTQSQTVQPTAPTAAASGTNK